MKVVIAKVHANLFNGDAVSLIAPTTDGIVQILAHHEPLVATLKHGTVIVKSSSGEQKFEVTDGVLEVSSDQATVLL